MRWSIPELIRNMRDEAKSLTIDGERKETNGDLINAVNTGLRGLSGRDMEEQGGFADRPVIRVSA